MHTPSSVKKWSSHYSTFKEASTNVWLRIFKVPFITVRDIKIQTFQYRLIQKTIPCNKWFHNIKIKNCVYDYCMNVNGLPHFFFRCLKVKEFWLHWFNWWENLSGIVIRNSQVIEECILFGFPSNRDLIQVLNFSILYAKYYIYIQHLFNINTLDLYTCLNQLKQVLKTEENKSIKNNKKETFLKYNFIYDNL